MDAQYSVYNIDANEANIKEGPQILGVNVPDLS